MRIGVFSDSPTVTTGFGITTNQVAHALADAGHDVVCFGLKAAGETFDRGRFPFKIWTVGIDEHWKSLIPSFFAHEHLDALLFNMDIFNMRECIVRCRDAGWRGPTISYLILDGIPAYKEYLQVQASMRMLLATTRTTADYLSQCGMDVFGTAPPGVDTNVFRSLPNSGSLRQEARLVDSFVVGVFGRNMERKQQVRVLIALAQLRQAGEGTNIILYFHCHPRGYWNLDEIADELGVADSVIFAESGRLDEVAGVPYVREETPSQVMRSTPSSPTMPSHFSYVERMNCCDLVVNVSHCGDFEQVLIEAQACGVPVAGTDDHSIMAEALGEGGILLNAADVSYWKAGQQQFLVAPTAVAEAIQSVQSDTSLRQELRATGIRNARKYPWALLRNKVVEAVANL
jgi:glycosyltransferase involved in cell wall biosynthesis